MHVATGIIRIPQYGPPNESGVRPVESSTEYMVRFEVLPRIGQVVTYGKESWVVARVEFPLASSTTAGELVAGPARVELDHLPKGGRSGSARSGTVLALILDEGRLQDPTYDGELRTFPALPRVGEFISDATRNPHVRYRVKEVNHVLNRRTELGWIEAEILIVPDGEPLPWKLRAQRPSDN
ncbi:hypothetical protein GobsT_23170 [Gemmata obscuriglobus]|uniref:Uncharacterized protein n=1 Tax=Gemmata obscuriglobus TaxID=114 RepID=A0A2Z3H0W0_9BACT|nr:hypothetical protein [Gemmata obscuriglobus]AWM39368.1 hypothetical protein C1280_21855 [Gemmata obscuriglobus]QEG27561.1 hypothetical protein GobsT_23170 [Gemmata obscuriglobus]VTS04643.1 unnamed protein product [Gemmata obscuriglobus UQM 2246]